MTVFTKPGWRIFRYDFKFQGKRYVGNTHQLTREDAQLVEREKQLALRHQAGGISQFFTKETPRFAKWANIFLDYKVTHLDRPDHVRWVTGVLLRFFGVAPRGTAKTPEAPYHDLRLGDIIAEPEWILKFEHWMTARGLGAQSKKHYRGMMRRMYRLAMQPQYRKATGVTSNPFVDLINDPTPGRSVIITPDQARAWITHAPHHVRLAIAIAALAPKLRLANILALRWTDIDPDPRLKGFRLDVEYYVTVRRHKTVRKTGRPLVAPLSRQLVTILKDAHRRNKNGTYVVEYKGQPVTNIRAGVREAAKEAGLVYGRDVEGGVIFHSLRHTAATLISHDEPDPLRLRDAIGHTDLSTTMKYRHMEPKHERPTLERLSKRLQLVEAVTGPRSGASVGPRPIPIRTDEKGGGKPAQAQKTQKTRNAKG